MWRRRLIIKASLSTNIATGLVSCSQGIGQSIREDIAIMFGQFHLQKATLGAKVLRLSKEKGWLIPPPQLAIQYWIVSCNRSHNGLFDKEI